MKSLFIASAAILALSLGSCGNKAEVDRLKKEIDSLNGVVGTSDANLEQYIKDFNEIQNNLNEVKQKEGIITSSAEGEVSEDTKTQIQNDLASIQQLMQDNKNKIAELQNKLKKSNNSNKDLQALLDGLQERVDSQEEEINRLRGELEAANIRIADLTRTTDSLSLENSGQKATIEEQTIALNTGYYAIGTFKELVNNKVIDKGGAFAAKSGSKLSKDMNMNYLTQIDVRNLGEISLGGTKKPRLVTSHPAGSYQFEPDAKKASKLVILDKTAFWKNSKYCVVILE